MKRFISLMILSLAFAGAVLAQEKMEGAKKPTEMDKTEAIPVGGVLKRGAADFKRYAEGKSRRRFEKSRKIRGKNGSRQRRDCSFVQNGRLLDGTCADSRRKIGAREI